MERFFKKYFWTLTLAVMILAGVVAGRTVSALASAKLADPPTLETTSASRAPRAVRGVTTMVDGRALAAVFGMRPPDPETLAETQEPEIEPGTEVPTSLNATLVATVEADPEDYSLALITDNASRATTVYGVGDTVMGSAELVRVERRRVLLRNNGRTEVLEMGEEGGNTALASAAPSVAPVTRAGPDESLGEGIKKTGDGQYVIAKEEIEKTLSNLNTIATQARIVPAFKNGVPQGFKLFSIRPGSIYAKIGVQNGDVIKSVNGYEINSPDKALEIYQKLQTASRVELEVERRGQSKKMTYNIE